MKPPASSGPTTRSAPKAATGYAAGLGGDDQIRIALEEVVARGGCASMTEIYDAVERRMAPTRLSNQGRASLRFFVNGIAVRAGYIYPHEKERPGWRITPEGREYLRAAPPPPEETVDVDTGRVEETQANSVRGAAFERYILDLLRRLHPNHAWFHQGERKSSERGLDFIGDRVGERSGGPASIGVQAKFHRSSAAPSTTEWLKFLAGCFARRVEHGIFVTTGRLTTDQRREAGEARVVVIEGREEIARIAKTHGLKEFDLFEVANEGASK
jgi:hypothetical protein